MIRILSVTLVGFFLFVVVDCQQFMNFFPTGNPATYTLNDYISGYTAGFRQVKQGLLQPEDIPTATLTPEASTDVPKKRFPIPEDAAEIGYNMLMVATDEIFEEAGIPSVNREAENYQYTQTPERVAEVNEHFTPFHFNLDLYRKEGPGSSGYQNWAGNERNEACWVYHPQSEEEVQQIVRDVNQHNDNVYHSKNRKLSTFEIPSTFSSSSSTPMIRTAFGAPTTNKILVDNTNSNNNVKTSMINHNALHEYQHVRVGGFGGSWGKLFADQNDVFVILDSMKQIYQKDPINRPDLVTVGAGVTNYELALWSESPARGEYQHCYVPINTLMVNGTVAGVLGTNSHGSSAYHPILADYVHEVKVVDSTGNIVIYNRDVDPEKTMLACGSMGLMGIVLEVTLILDLEKCAGYHVEGHNILFLPIMRKQPNNPKRKNPLKQVALNNDYFLMLGLPFSFAWSFALADLSSGKMDLATYKRATSSWSTFIQYDDGYYFDIDKEVGHMISVKYDNRTLDECPFGSTRDHILSDIPQAYEWQTLDITTIVQDHIFKNSLNSWHRKYTQEMMAMPIGSLPILIPANIENGTFSGAKGIHFSRHTDRKPLLDLSIVVKADETTEWDNVYNFWRKSYEVILNTSVEFDFLTPNIFTAVRVIRGSESPLAFTKGDESDYFISFDFGTWIDIQYDAWQIFSSRMIDIGVEYGTHSDGSIPQLHWAKCSPGWFAGEEKLKSYVKASMKNQMDAVRPILKEADPHGLFTNDFLRDVFEI